MTNNSKLRASAFALTISISSVASAQQSPGTNVPTPLPTQPGVPASTPGTLGVDSGSPPVATVGSTLAQEPVIDAQTTSTSFPNRPLLVTSFVLLAAAYAPAALVAATSDREADEKLYYPVVGPWLDLNHRGCAANPCDNNDFNRGLLVADGIVQGAGALGVLLSLVVPQKTTKSWYLIGNRDVLVAPRISSSQLGLHAVGRF